MEHVVLLCLYFLLLFVSFIIIIAIIVLFYKHKLQFSHPNLPPGKTGLPIIGETFQFVSCGWKSRPHEFVAKRMLESSSQVFKTSIIGEPTAVFCGLEGNKFLFSNENKLVRVTWPKHFNKIFPVAAETSVESESKKLRELLPQFLKPDALQRYIKDMDVIAQKHFESNWDNKCEVLVAPLAKKYTFALASQVFISIDDPTKMIKLEDSFNLLTAGLFSLPIDFPGTAFNRAIKASDYIRKEILMIIKQRKIDLAQGTATPSQDILSHMLLTCTEDGQYMKKLDIADKIQGLLLGGYDTASIVCTFIVKYLAQLPHIYQNVYRANGDCCMQGSRGFFELEDLRKMKYSWNVACEVLRLTPPLQTGFREALSDFVFKGFFIPKGWKLCWSIHTTHNDPKFFPKPEKFDPSRHEEQGPTPYTYIPFGGGPRMCPGKEFARLEILIFMHHLVKRFKLEKLVVDEKTIVDPVPRPAKGLPIRLHPH